VVRTGSRNNANAVRRPPIRIADYTAGRSVLGPLPHSL
jgi:hypothetical protein